MIKQISVYFTTFFVEIQRPVKGMNRCAGCKEYGPVGTMKAKAVIHLDNGSFKKISQAFIEVLFSQDLMKLVRE